VDAQAGPVTSIENALEGMQGCPAAQPHRVCILPLAREGLTRAPDLLGTGAALQALRAPRPATQASKLQPLRAPSQWWQLEPLCSLCWRLLGCLSWRLLARRLNFLGAACAYKTNHEDDIVRSNDLACPIVLADGSQGRNDRHDASNQAG